MRNIIEFICENSKATKMVDSLCKGKDKFIDFLGSPSCIQIFKDYLGRLDAESDYRNCINMFSKGAAEALDTVCESPEDWKDGDANSVMKEFIENIEFYGKDTGAYKSDNYTDLMKSYGIDIFYDLWDTAGCPKLS